MILALSYWLICYLLSYFITHPATVIERLGCRGTFYPPVLALLSSSCLVVGRWGLRLPARVSIGVPIGTWFEVRLSNWLKVPTPTYQVKYPSSSERGESKGNGKERNLCRTWPNSWFAASLSPTWLVPFLPAKPIKLSLVTSYRRDSETLTTLHPQDNPTCILRHNISNSNRRLS